MKDLIEQLSTRRTEVAAQLQRIPQRAKEAGRGSLTSSEIAEFSRLQSELEDIDERISELRDRESRQRIGDAASARIARAGGVRVGRESSIYRPDGEHSYFGDLAARQLRSDHGAFERLARYAAEQRDLTRTDTAGGEFVPPLWLMDEYAALARAGRVTADRLRTLPLPSGTDSINVPRITTGGTVAPQADLGTVSETDWVTASVAAPVNTIAGQIDMALQLLEQSPAGMDAVIFADLIADYAEQLDSQVLNGNGTPPNHRGILNVSGIEVVTYTSATPSVPEFYPRLADAIQRVATLRFRPAEAIVMHPRRWAWITAALDTTDRPLVVPTAHGPGNALAISAAPTQEGAVGVMGGLPVYLDANIPTTLGGGTEDIVIVARFSDLLLWESTLRTRVLSEVLSGTLAVRCQVYSYSAAMSGRYPKAIATIGGSGLAAPSFA